MRKLNKKKIKWIVKEVERRELGVWTIAQAQNITKQHAYRVAKKFKNREPEFKKPGRKSKCFYFLIIKMACFSKV